MTQESVTLPRAAMERALEALSLALSDVDWRKDSPTQPVIHKAYNATCAALEQPQHKQDPVAEIDAALNAYAQAFLARATGWTRDVGDDFEAQRVRLYRAIVAYARKLACQQQPMVERPQSCQEPDWQDMYQKEKRRAEMWIAKYEQDIGKLERAVPAAAHTQVEQEPVAWMFHAGDIWKFRWHHFNRPMGDDALKYWKPIFTHPQPKREPLKNERIRLIESSTHFHESRCWAIRFARAIEAAHNIK